MKFEEKLIELSEEFITYMILLYGRPDVVVDEMYNKTQQVNLSWENVMYFEIDEDLNELRFEIMLDKVHDKEYYEKFYRLHLTNDKKHLIYARCISMNDFNRYRYTFEKESLMMGFYNKLRNM
ncbi:hypothetical protein D3C81_921740 [compost metagenome]